MSANNTFPENSPYSQYSYKNLNYVNPYSNFEEDEDSYPSEFVKADINAIDAIVNHNRALEIKDYKAAEIYQKEYEYYSKLAQFHYSYEEQSKKQNAFNLFLKKQNISEDQRQGLIPEYNKLIVQTFLKGLTQQYIDAEKKDALSNMPVPIGETLLQTTIVGGVSLNIPKFNIKSTGQDRENLIYNYLEKYFYEDINKQFETNERLKNYYKPANEESVKKENERYNKEYADYVSGKRTTIPSKPKYQNDFFEDLLYSTVDKTKDIKPEDAYYNGLYNFYNDIYKRTINVQAYGSEKAKQGYYDQSKPVTVVGSEPYISTNMEFFNYTVGREINNMVEDFATRKSEQLIMSRSIDRLEYKEFKKSHAKELKTLALNSDKNKLEKRFNITLHSENGINQNTYNKVYNDFIRGEAKDESGSYNDEERDVYKIIDAYLTDKDLLTSGEIANFKTNVQDGGIWFGALKLAETNLVNRLALKFSNRLNSDSKQDRRTTIMFDDGTSVILKENVDPLFSGIYDKEELDEFTKIYEENKSIQEQRDIKSYINTVVTKEVALQIEKSLYENPENIKTIEDYKIVESNFILKEAQKKIGSTPDSPPNDPNELLDFIQKGYINVEENKNLEKIISIDTDKEGFIGATIYGKKFKREQVRVIQQYEALELIKSNNEKTQEYFKEIKNSSFWDNFGEGLFKGISSIPTSIISLYVGNDMQYYNNTALAFENGLAEKYRGSIIAGNYNNNFEQLVVKKEENGENVIVANNIPEQIMDQEELIYLQSIKNKNEALDSWSNNAGLLTRVGESVGTSAWFMAEMALTWGVYGAIGKGLIGTANAISRGMMAGAKGISSASESMMIGAGVRLGAKGVSVGTKAIGYVDAGVGYGLKGIGSIVEGGSYAAKYFGTTLEIGKFSKIAQFPARLVQNTIANSVLSLVSPSTINFVMDDMNSKGKVHYVDVNGVTVPVGHTDVAAFLYDIEKQNYQEFKNTILDNDDKLLAYYGISGDVKNKKEILEKLRFDYNESFNKRQDELSFIKDKKGPQLYSSIAQGIYEQFLERFTETSIGSVLDLALRNTFGKLAGRAEMWLGKDTRVITELSKKSAVLNFTRELTGIGAYEGGNFLQKTGFLGMKFINNYLFGRATVNGFVNSPLSEIGEEIFRQLLPTKVFNIPDGKTFLSSYAEDIAQLSYGKWWEEVSASVLLTTTMMKLGGNTIRSINDAGTNRELKDAKTIEEISIKRNELIKEFKDKPELKRKLNEFDAKNPLFITTPKTSGVKRRLMEDITLDINYANEEALLGKWAAGNSFGVLMGQADIDYVSGWMAKSSKLNNVNISKEDAKAILMKKMVNNIAHVFSLRQENTVEALTLLKQRYETFFGKAKDGKSLMLDVINTQIDIEKKFNAKLTSLSKEIKTDDKIKLAFILRNISTQFHKTRHSMVELDLLKDTINSMFESNLPDEQKELISTISKLIGEINDNFFTNDFSLESNNEFKKDLATKLITLSRSIASLKNKTNDENQKVILEAGYQLLQKNMSNFTSFFASKSKISEIENDYYKSQLLSMIKKGINADVIEERLKGKLSKESQEFLNLYKTRSKNNSRQIKSSDLSNGDIIVKLLKDNQVKILIVNKELLPDGTIKTTLFDSLGNIEEDQENLWTATEEEAEIFVNEQQKLSKPSSVNTSTVYRPKHHFFKLTKDLMSSRKKALNYFYNWLQTEKDNLKNDTKSLEELYIYAEKIETALIEYFNLPNNRKKEVDLSDYGFDTTSEKAMIEIEPINIDSASNLDPEFILYLKRVYKIYNIKKIKDLKKLMKRKLGLFFDIKELESYKETVSEKSYNNYIENKINEFINEHLKNVYSFGFNLNEVREQLKNEDTTEPIKIDEKGEYVFYDGKIHESKSFNKELYDFNNDIDPVSGMRKSQIVPQQNTNTKTTTEKTTEKNIETTTEKVEEKKEENTNDTQKDTSIKETSNESTAEESEQIKENTKEEIKNTSIIEEEKITSEYKIPELTKEEENLSDEERKNIVDENLKTIDFDELSDDDLYSFYSEEFSTLSELDEEFKKLTRAQINAIVKIAKAIKLQRITTWDNVVQFMINKSYLRDDSPISMIELIRYAAFLADIHVSKSTITEWFETIRKTNFKQYYDNKLNLNTHSISEDDVDDLLKFEKDIDVLYFQLTETQTPVDDSSFTVLWKNKDNRFYDKNQQEVNDENKSIVPYDYDNNITSNLFLRVPIRWNENGEQTDFLYVELPKQNLKNGLTNITKIFKKIKKATNISEANKKTFLWAYMVEANPELRDNKKLQEHIKKFNFNDSNFQDINFKTHSLIYDINKGFQIVEKFSLNLFDIRIPFEIVNSKNENGEVLQTLSGIMDDDTMNNGGISINELKELQAKKIEEKNKAEQLNRSELGLALVNVKKTIVKEVIHATLKKLKNRDISISTMLILIKDKIDEYVEKNYKKLNEKEKDLLKSQMLGLIPGTYDNSVSSEFAQLIGISKETTLNFIKRIEDAKIKLENKKNKEQREFLLEKDPSELSIEEIEWLDNNLESDDLTKSEIEIALFGMADNQLSCEQKLSTIIGLALYGIEYKDVDNITRYLSVGEAIQLFVSAYSLGTEGYNWSFDHTHRNVQEKMNNNDYSEDLKTTLNALFNRINDLSKDYEIGEAIIRELYTKMDVEGISFLALQRQLDEQSDFIKSKLIEIGTSNAMAKSDSAMFKGAVKSGLIELKLKEGFVIDGFAFNENKKNEANDYMRNIITINDPLYKKEYIKLFFKLIGLTQVPDSAIELLLKLNSDTKVNDYFKEGGIFYELINKDVVSRKSFNLIFTVNNNNEEQYNNISDIFKKTMLYEEQSFYDNGKLSYNLKNKSHTDDINNFLKYGDEHKRRKFLEEKHSFIGEVLLGDLTLADELYTQRLSSDLSRISGYEYFESFKDLTDDNKKIAMYNLFKQSSKFKKQINGFNIITFKALGITQSDYDVIDVNNTFGVDFISDIVFHNGEILITDRALDFIALHFFKEDVYRMKKFQENKIKNRRDMSQTGMLFLNIPELNSYRTDDGDTLNYLAVETITESDINYLYEKYKNVINNTVKDSIINDIFGILEYDDKELTIKNYDKTKNGFIDEFSDNNDIAKKIGNFIINQKLSYNNSLSLYFDDINDIEIKNDAILFAGGNINKRILDKEEYDFYNNEEISTLASNMLNTKDLKQQEELWDNLNEKINKITGMPHKPLQIEGTLNYNYEQNIKQYIQDALKDITNRARKLRSPSVRIFKGFTETFYGKKTYSILQLESFERPSEVLYKYMELHNIGTINERQILKDSINDQNLKTQAEEIIKKYKNNKIVKVYSQMEEADGQEYESWRFRLSSLLAEGKVTNAQFEELKGVFEKQMKELKSGKGIKTKLPDWLNDEYFAINKPLQVGNIDGRGLYVKSASACLIPDLIESSKELTQLAIKLDNFENTNHTIARVAFQSAIKQGQIRQENSITKENILNPTFVFSNINAINDIDLYSYGLQVENPQIVDEESLNVLTSQGTKMFLSGVVAETREHVFEFLGKKYNGKELNEKYIQIMTELSNRKLEACLSDYGVLRNIETNRYEIIKGNKYYKQLKRTLEEALKYDNREIGLIYKYKDKHGNIIESTKEYDEERYELVSIEFDLEIWKQDQRGELQTVLMADIRNYAAKHKIHGNKLKVMSSFGFENLERKKLSIKDVKEENKVLLTNDYTGRLGAHVENGVIVHHVLAPMDIIVSTKNGIEKMDLSIYLNEDGVLVLPEELKYKFSWRVPLSGIQSSSIIKVVGFLPKAVGNILVTSQESAVQLGEDFDFDTRFTYNTVFNSEGKFIKNATLIQKKNLSDALDIIEDEEKQILDEIEKIINDNLLKRQNISREKYQEKVKIFKDRTEDLNDSISYQLNILYPELEKESFKNIKPQILNQPNTVLENHIRTYEKLKKLNFEKNINDNWIAKFLVRHNEGKEILNRVKTKEEAISEMLKYFNSLGEKIKVSDEYFVREISDSFIERQLNSYRAKIDIGFREEWKSFKADKENKIKERREKQRASALNSYTTLLNSAHYSIGLKILFLEAILKTEASYNKEDDTIKQKKRDKSSISIPIPLNEGFLVEMESTSSLSDNNILYDYFYTANNYTKPKLNFENYKNNIYKKTEKGIWYKFEGEKDLNRFHDMSALSTGEPGAWCTRDLDTAKTYLLPEGADSKIFIFYSNEENTPILQLHIINDEANEIGGLAESQNLRKNTEDYNIFREFVDNDKTFTTGKLENYIQYSNALIKLNSFDGDFDKLDYEDIEAIYNGKQYYKDTSNELEEAKKKIPKSFYAALYNVDEKYIHIGDINDYNANIINDKNIKLIVGNLSLYTNSTLIANSLEAVDGDISLKKGATLTVDSLKSVNYISLYRNSTLTANSLEAVTGNIHLSIDSTLTVDSLKSVNYISLNEGATLTANSLKTVRNDISLNEGATLTSDSLKTIEGDISLDKDATLTANSLETVGGRIFIFKYATLTANLLETVNGRIHLAVGSTLTANSLKTIEGDISLSIDSTLTVDSLKTVGGISLYKYATLTANSLETVTGNIYLDENATLTVDSKTYNNSNIDELKSKLLSNNNTLYQGNKAAFVTSSKSDKKYLVFGKGSDITSAIHEKAHEFEETLTEDEIKIVEQWCGYKRGTTNYKEAFAKGAEKAIYEGDFYDDSTYLGKIYKKFTAFFKKYITEAINYFKDINELNEEILEIYQNMFLNYEDSVPQYTNNNDNQKLLTLTEDKFVYDASYYTIDSSGLFGIGYDDLSNEEKIIALNNTIIDLFKSILLANNAEVQKAITNPINFEIMTETKKILEENKKEDRFTSVLDIDGQIAQMNDGSIGKLGVALASMYNTLQSMFGMADEKAPIKFKNPANGKYQNLNFGNISFDGSKGFSNRAIGGRLVSELGSEKQNGFVDNRKMSQMLALGVTEDTINQYLIMTLIYGIDKEIIDETTGKAVDYSATFMQLPIIKEYNKRLKKEYNNKTFNPKTTYDEIEKELQEKYLSKTTIDSFDKNTREYFNNQEKFRLKNSKSLTAKKIIELSNREFDSLEQEEKDILYSAFMNFKILSYQVGNMKKLNTIFGFEKNLIKKTNNSLENSTNEIIQILEGKHKINKSIENLDNLFGKIKTRDEIAGSEYNEYMELQRRYEDISDDDISEKKDIRSKLIEAKKRYYNRINKYIFIGKIDNEYKYLEPKHAIMARILSSRGYVELFENEFLSKQEWMNTLTKELDNYLNKQLMSAEKHGKYQESLRKFIIGIFNDNIITQLIDEDYRLDNGVVLTKQTFDSFINGDLYYLILEYCKNNQFNENKFIRSLYLDITKGKTNITIAYNNLNANKKELKDSVLELFNNNNNNQINSETEQLIKFKGTQYSQKDIMTLISLYAFKTNNINLISLLPSKFKESIQYNQRLSSIDYYLDNMDNSLVNTEDVFIVRKILNVDYIIDGAYYFNNKQKTLLDAALTKLNINHEFKNGQVILKDIKKENIKNYPLLFILQNAYLVSSMDEDKIPGLKRFFTEEKIKELHENNVLSFTRKEIINYFGWSNNDIHTRSKNLEYSRFNIFDKEKKENITIICHINESNSMVHFYPVNSPVKTAEEEERVIVIPETKNNNFIETNESNENEGTQHYEQIVKDKSLFNTETSTIYLTSSGLGTVMLADKFIQGEDVPSWFLESNGLRSLFTTSKKTVPVMAGIMFEDAIKEVQKTNDYSIENITEILKEKFSPKTFLGFDKNGKQLTVKTKTKKDKRFGIDRYVLSDEKTKKSINKICSDENIKDMAISIRAYLLSNSKYQSFESFQETLPEDSPLKEGLISIETKYGKLMLATIPDQIAINDNTNELIDIKFLQKEFTTKEEAISHVFNTYLQHITYPYSIYKKTGRETSFRYGIFAKVDGTLYYFESDKVTINNTNEQTYFNNIQSYVKKALNLFNADNDIFPLKYKQEYANALTYSSENKGHLKLNYITEHYLTTLEEANIDDNGFLYKLALLKSEIKEKEQDFFNDLSRQDFEIKNKEEYFNRYIKKRDTPFTNTLRQVFINTNVVITNSKTKYNSETNTIYINRKEQTKEAILEETIHAATFNYISQYGKATIDFNELKLTYKLEKNAPQEIVDLFSLYEKTFDMFIKNAKERLNPIEFENMILDLRWKQFGKNFIDNKVVYAAYDISDPYEFVASFWKNTEGAKFLEIKDTRNILQKIWEILLKIFHLSNNITLDNNEKAYKKIVVSIVENNINNNVWYSENKETVNLTASNQIKQDNSELKC